MAFFTAILAKTIHPDFRQLFANMTLLDKFLFMVIHWVDRIGKWHRLPVALGGMYLVTRRHLHQKYNLIHVGPPRDQASEEEKLHDPFHHQGSFFGRNMRPVDQSDKLLEPHPTVVATKLLARREFKDTGKQFNMIAASWIQFMIHDWVDHLEDSEQIELVAPSEVASQCPLKSFKFFKTKEVPTELFSIRIGHTNVRSPWWDGSALYGATKEQRAGVRTYKDGKLKISSDGLLSHDEHGVAIAGDVRNSWAGVSVLQALFAREHNAVCDALKREYPDLDEEDLYCHARLVTSSVIAKIHTIDWTVELLKTDLLHLGMRSNWYGLLGKRFKDTFGHTGVSLLSGFVGQKQPQDHGVPYSLTEEFTSVYRMHSLLPDHMELRDTTVTPGRNKTPPLIKRVPMADMSGLKGEKTLSGIGFTQQMVSMGHQASGALELFNYPSFLRDLIPHDFDGKERPGRIDLAALEIHRDRERQVPRYNDFRRGLMLLPIKKWEDLTDNPEAINALREVYGDDVESLDLLVGLMGEKKIKGFAISETSFVIFLLMATRRLEADPFFTSSFNEQKYTKKGLEWVNTTESLRDVLGRHYPDMLKKWVNSKRTSLFSVWDSPGPFPNPIPRLLRFSI